MVGQPLTTLHTNGNYMFGTTPLLSHPGLMALVANAIAGWAVTESHFGNAFAGLIGSKRPVTMEMYAAFGFAVQKRLLITAATEILLKRYGDIFRCTLSVLERSAKERHRFAHGIWGVSADPDFSAKILLLADPKDFWRMSVKRLRYFRQKGLDVQAKINAPRIDLKLIRAYRKSDLEKVCEQMEQSWQYANALCLMINSKAAVRQNVYRKLASQPAIAATLEKDRRGHTKQKHGKRY